MNRKTLKKERKKGNFKKPKKGDIDVSNDLYFFHNKKKIRRYKKRYDMSSKNYKNNKIGGIIILVLIVAAIIFLGVVSKGFTNWDIKTWFGTKVEEIDDEEEEEVEEAGINISALNVTADLPYEQSYFDVNVVGDNIVLSYNGGYIYSIYTLDISIFEKTTLTKVQKDNFDMSFIFSGVSAAVSYTSNKTFNAPAFNADGRIMNYIVDSSEFSLNLPVLKNIIDKGYSLQDYYFIFLGAYTLDGDANTWFTSSFYGSPRIILNANGGIVESTTYDILPNELFTPPTPTYYGYKFLGWYTDAGELYNPDNPVTESFTLTAQWEPIIYLVQFNSNGENDIDDVFIQQGKTLTLPTPIKTGYNFKGWYLNGELYTVSPVESNLILIAEWELKILTVIFNANGGTETATIQVAYGNTFQLPAEPEKIGYIFKGWKLSGALYVESSVTANITLVAQWDIIKLTVTFYVEGEAVKSILVDYGTTLYQLRQKASAEFLNIKSISFENLDDLGAEFIVTDNVLIIAEKQGTQQSVVTFLTQYWYLVVGGVVLLALIGALIYKGKKGGN